MAKLKIYFNEFNIPTDNTVYFPYSSGLLLAYCLKSEDFCKNYCYAPFLFKREPVSKILEKYDNPDIACFSSSIWNHRLNLTVAKELKIRYPSCLIVFGGPQVPLDKSFYTENSFIDIGVFGEGEIIFRDLLLQYLKKDDKFPHHVTLKNDITTKEIDIFPSPYSLGLFNQLIKDNPDIEFKAILETNRSCPFSCDFCFWGQSDLNKKIVFHSLEYTSQEAEWLAQNKVQYIFCADANFGMYKRDIEVAKLFADTKEKYKYPDKFRVCYGKNVTDTIFQTALILSKANLAKTVTLAKQSNDKDVLANIHRSNINTKTFKQLQIKYTEAGIPTYTELILGLPGETYTSFLSGLEEVLESVINNQVFIYHCQILPNTEMAKPEYLKKHGMKTVEIPLAEVHGSVRDNSIVQEVESIVVGTTSMTIGEWKKCAVIAWLAQTLYGLKAADDIVNYLIKTFGIRFTDYFEFIAESNLKEVVSLRKIAAGIVNGEKRCQHDPKFGSIYYDPEEFIFLSVCEEKKRFLSDLFQITVSFLVSKGLVKDLTQSLDLLNELDEVFSLQLESLPSIGDYSSSQEFATKVMLHGRKSNMIKKPRSPIGFQLI